MGRKDFGKKVWWIYLVVVVLCLLVTVITDRAVTTISENAPLTYRRCVIIDAGHGGIDSGAVSCTGEYESVINLQIAKRLEDLMHLMGIQTKMLRKTDEDISVEGSTIATRKLSDLKERVRLINMEVDGILISIHQNTYLDNRYAGPQTFYASTHGSKELAELLQKGLTESLLPQSKRKAKKADKVYLMEHIDTTGVLVECGFLSNPEEEAKLRDPKYQVKVCGVIASVVSQYLNT